MRARDRRKANEARRAACAAKQAVLPLGEQLERRDERAAAHAARYPRPPVYHTILGDDSLRGTPKPTTPRVPKSPPASAGIPLLAYITARMFGAAERRRRKGNG